MKTKRYNFVAALVAIMMFALVFAPIAGCEDSEAATDYWTYTVTSDGKVTGSGSAVTSPTAAGAVGTTGKYTSSNGSHVGSWGFDSDGYGPFGSFYAAFDACHGNKILCHLNPNDLTVSVDGTIALSSYSGHTINIMWVLPTVYWSVNSSGNLVLSNDPSKGTAYAHTIDGDIHEYLGIGVYEASTATVGGKTVLTSTTGTTPLYSQQRSTFRDYANNNTVATEDGTTVTGHAMLWNLYAWQLYRFSVLTVGSGWNSQGIFGNGDVYGGHYGSSVNKTGDLDKSGPYAGNVGNSGSSATSYHSDSVKAFIEDAWGSLYDFVDGVLIYYNNSQVQMYATQSSTPTNSSSDYTTMIGVLPSSSGYGSTSTSSSTNAGFWGLPTGTSGSATSGLYDYIYSSTASSFGSPYGLYVGGYSSDGTSNGPRYGLSYMYANIDVTNSYTYIGGRLAFVFDADPASTPTVTYDHSALTEALGDGGTAASNLTKKKTITENGTYDQLPQQGDWKHTGWIIDGVTYSTTANFVHQTSHTAKSVWSKYPIATLNHDALVTLGVSSDTIAGLDSELVIESASTAYPDLGTVDGFTHIGWYVDGVLYSKDHVVVKNSDHTAYSAWRAPTIVISYIVEGTVNGTLEVPKGSVGIVYTPLNVEGVFMGWYYDSNYSNKYDSTVALTENTSLYAKGVKPLTFTSVPTANATITNVDASGLYFFDCTDSEGRCTVLWDFGDGNTSTDPIAYNSYAEHGTYKVTLTVTNASGQTAVSHYDVVYGDSADGNGASWGLFVLGAVLIIVTFVILRRLV